MFDFKMPGMDTPEGQGLLAAAFSLLQARKMPGDRGIGGALGAAGQQYMGTRSQAQDQMQRRKFQDLQMTAAQRQLEQQQEAERRRAADEAAVRGSIQGGNFDPRQFLQNNPTASLGALKQGMEFNSALNPAPKFETVAPGSSMYRMGPNGPELAMTAPDKPQAPEKEPEAIRQLKIIYGDGTPAYQAALLRLGAKTTTHQPGTNVSVNTGQKGFDNTLKLRGDFRSEPIYKAHQEVQSAYSQIQQGLKMASPAGDLAGATKIMKLLDPGSVVRESELGMAMAATGAIDRLENYATNIIRGTKLTPSQRKDFQTLADRLYGESVKQFNAKRSEYQGIAERNQLNVPDVVGSEVKPANNGWGITRVP